MSASWSLAPANDCYRRLPSMAEVGRQRTGHRSSSLRRIRTTLSREQLANVSATESSSVRQLRERRVERCTDGQSAPIAKRAVAFDVDASKGPGCDDSADGAQRVARVSGKFEHLCCRLSVRFQRATLRNESACKRQCHPPFAPTPRRCDVTQSSFA